MKKYFVGIVLLLSISLVRGAHAQETVTPENKTGDIDIESKVIDLVGGPDGFMETFRKKQAVYFSVLRDETKKKLGISTTSELGETLPAPVPFTAGESANDLPHYKQDNPMDYVTLIFSTSMASVFSEVLLFYITIVILTFVLIRLFFKMFI